MAPRNFRSGGWEVSCVALSASSFFLFFLFFLFFRGGGTYKQDKVIGVAPDDQALEEAGGVAGDGGAVIKDAQGHHGVGGDAPLDEDVDGVEQEADDHGGDDVGGPPGVHDAARGQADEEEGGGGGEDDEAEPVDGGELLDKGGGVLLEAQAEVEPDDGGDADGQVDPKDPAPARVGADGTADGDSVVLLSVSLFHYPTREWKGVGEAKSLEFKRVIKRTPC